jgi:hypothetical protein
MHHLLLEYAHCRPKADNASFLLITDLSTTVGCTGCTVYCPRVAGGTAPPCATLLVHYSETYKPNTKEITSRVLTDVK